MKRHALTDEQWELIEPLIPRSEAKTGRPAKDRRLMLDGTLWILATGAPWRDLPERFGPFQNVHRYFSAWRKAGVFAKVVEALQVKLDNAGLIDWDLWLVDGSNVRASRVAAGARKKRGAASTSNPPTTRWAARAADGDQSSTWLLTERALCSPSPLPRDKRTNPRSSTR